MAQIFISLTPWGFTVITVGFLVIWKENHLYHPVLLSQCQQMVYASPTDHSDMELWALQNLARLGSAVASALPTQDPGPWAFGPNSCSLLKMRQKYRVYEH